MMPRKYATPPTIETIAEHSYRGTYDFRFTDRLVQRGTDYYLLHDVYCGSGVEGECPRAHIYVVPADKVSEVREIIEGAESGSRGCLQLYGWDFGSAIGHNETTKGDVEGLTCIGRASAYPWMADALV